MLGDKVILERAHLQELWDALHEQGYRVVGPTVREGAIVYGELASVSELPEGWTDEQDAGSYRLKKRSDRALFGYAVGPHSWKKFLHPPVLRLWSAKRDGQRKAFEIESSNEKIPKYAFLGVRSCELHAIAIQDRVFTDGKYIDTSYLARREKALIIGVNCGQAGGTCFCVSMQTGPRATLGYDLVLTEILEDEQHYFVIEVGSAKGDEVLGKIRHKRAAGDQDARKIDAILEKTAQQMGRSLDTTDIKNLLYRNLEASRWDEVANRCLSCANCTMVCPTCFCTTVEDVTDLTGRRAERVRKWDSCFTSDFSHIHGGSVRASPKSRFRQWMTHKLATWIDQFDTSGCVGCGRCITWCPVGIDITEEARAIRENSQRREDNGID
jgi:formate hydrogenlyase subunit 6/NADH:ubiquinone oxidoreductase subunit I